MMDVDFEELRAKVREIVEDSTSLATGIKAWMLLSKEGLPIDAASGGPSR
ncbi:MAG: hypothetical protein ACTSPE_10340 [Candidatus Thorarchaeota archaeon]